MPEKIREETRPKRDAILESAQTLFARKGYEETTIADIAREAGIAVGTVYLYFHNKHEVYTAVVLHIENKLAMTFEDPSFLNLPAEQVIRAMVEATFNLCHEYTGLMTLLQVDIQSAEEARQHQHSNDRLTRAIERILQHMVERGQLASFNTAMYAQFLNLFGEAAIKQCFNVEGGERENLYREYLIELFERLLFGPSLKQGTA